MSGGQGDTKFEEWAKLELFGRQVLAGRVSEQTIAGAGFIRIDVPAAGELPGFTRFFYPSAVYGITPTTEELATKLAHAYRENPISRYELPAPAQPTSPERGDPNDREPDVDDEDEDDDSENGTF